MRFWVKKWRFGVIISWRGVFQGDGGDEKVSGRERVGRLESIDGDEALGSETETWRLSESESFNCARVRSAGGWMKQQVQGSEDT